MKHLILFCMVFTICLQTIQAQPGSHTVTDNTSQYQFYVKKRNTNNTIGYVCLATGLTVGFVGAVEIVSTGAVKHTDAYKSKANTTFAAGNVIALASIPFFVIANNDKKKASLSLGSGAVMIDDKAMPNTGYAKLTLTLRL